MEIEKRRPRTFIRLFAVAAALACLLAVVTAVRALPGRLRVGLAARLDHPPTGNRPLGPEVTQGANTAWAGWIDVADPRVAFRSVSATFAVPTVTCTVAGSEVALWVGLDGYPHGNPTIEQVGITAECVQSIVNGVYPTYFAWYQMGLGGPVTRRPVRPGDMISAAVRYEPASRRYRLSLADNRTPSADFRTSLPCPEHVTCHNSSAEVITEDPNGGYSAGYPLANFGVTYFSHVRVTSAGGMAGKLAATSRWDVDCEVMVNAGSTVVAEPYGRENGGAAFSVAFTPDLVLAG